MVISKDKERSEFLFKIYRNIVSRDTILVPYLGTFRAFNGVVGFLWAALLLAPYDLFQASPTYQSFGRMTETVWGLIALVIFSLYTLAVARKDGLFICVTLVLVSGFWGAVAFMFWSAPNITTGALIYTAMTIFSIIQAMQQASAWERSKPKA